MFSFNAVVGGGLMMAYFKQTIVACWLNDPINVWLWMTGIMKYSWLINTAGMNYLTKVTNVSEEPDAFETLLNFYQITQHRTP
jgi:hypothetical protein